MRSFALAVTVAVLGCHGDDDSGMLCPYDDDAVEAQCSPMPDAAPPLPRLDTPEDVMTWVPFPTTTCGNGTPAGIGVRRTSLSDDLFIYFSGGGACWDYQSCFVDKKSVHVDETYTEAMLHQEADGLVFDHSQTANPLSKASIVYVPYCTGDLHSGRQVTTYTGGATPKMMHHTGFNNFNAFVTAIKQTFPNAQHIWVAGSSAGGYGATFNFDWFSQAWPAAESELLQDSSPFVQPLVNFDAWKSSWAMQLPVGCAQDCVANFPSIVDAVATAHPTSRIALMHYNNDATIRDYFGYTSLVGASNALIDTQYSHPNTKAFMVAGDAHTMFGGIATIVGPGNVPLLGWVNQWLIGDPAWATVRP